MYFMRVVHYKSGLISVTDVDGDHMQSLAAEMHQWGSQDSHQRLTKQGLIISHIDTNSNFKKEILNRKGISE